MNSKARCKGCRAYRLQSVMTKVGLSFYCPNCKPTPYKKTHKGRTVGKRKPSRKLNPDLRAEVLQRDGGVCRRCGSNNMVELHHINYRSQGGPDANWNLIALCDPCHKGHEGVHSDKRYWQPILRAYIWLRYTKGSLLTIPEVERRVKNLD